MIMMFSCKACRVVILFKEKVHAIALLQYCILRRFYGKHFKMEYAYKIIILGSACLVETFLKFLIQVLVLIL